jgi:hypothetical protein
MRSRVSHPGRAKSFALKTGKHQQQKCCCLNLKRVSEEPLEIPPRRDGVRHAVQQPLSG